MILAALGLYLASGGGWATLLQSLGMVAALGLALLVDRLLGEPATRWHPVAWMGGYLGWAGRWLAAPPDAPAGPDTPRFVAGALAWWGGAVVVSGLALLLQWLVAQGPWWLAVLLTGLLLKPLLAWRMLRDEVAAVEAALAESVEAGRARLALLVSRDVAQLDAEAVRESAIESLAENFNDSVVAPVFWFILLGLPGAALYRFANTADAMWGYRGRWEWGGKWAARADDVLSWLPARLSALLLLASARCLALPTVWRQARHTPSPNSGWPMAAMAVALGLRLRKPGVYVLHAPGQPPTPADTQRALALGGKALVLLFGAVLALTVLAVVLLEGS
jgi:adenosylcobinamide-phosphate synthase